MINEKNLITEIKDRFPFFNLNEEFQDILTYVGGVLSDYIITNIREHNNKIVDEAVKFVNQLTEESENSVGAFLDEIVLNMYTSAKEEYVVFKGRLSSKAKKYFEYAENLWDSQNSL